MMSSDLALNLSKQFLWQALLISSPVVIAVFISGIIISVLQVVTQIQDSVVNTAPKILVAVIALILSAKWMLYSLVHFTQSVFYQIPQVVQ